VLFALNQTLLQHESLRAGSLQVPYTTEDLIKHYNCGDLRAIIFNHDTSQLPHFINSSLPDHERITAQQIDSYFRQELIYKRNERMGRRITELLEGNPGQAFFFAFGAEEDCHKAQRAVESQAVVKTLNPACYPECPHPPAEPSPVGATGTPTVLARPHRPCQNLRIHSRASGGVPRGHFLGNYTVLDILRQEGYEVEHTPSGQPITEKPDPSAGSPSETELPPLRHPLGTGFPDAALSEEEPLTPHLLLPDSLSQLEEFGRQKKRPRKQQRQQGRQRQFNDLWVRMEDRSFPLMGTSLEQSLQCEVAAGSGIPRCSCIAECHDSDCMLIGRLQWKH
ncbi:TIKI2 Metalloprotease, partial [Polyodon spathula]|nr:TIKI2 Metalloprotease [Polyodon spathula]